MYRIIQILPLLSVFFVQVAHFYTLFLKFLRLKDFSNGRRFKIKLDLNAVLPPQLAKLVA